MKNLFKKIIYFIFQKRIAELKAQKIADNIQIKTVKKVPNNKYQATLEPLKIYSEKKPEIINFISDTDYQVLLNFYTAHLYGSKTDLNKILSPCPYKKYDWNVLLQIVWTYQNSCKTLEEMKKAGIKKVEIDCKECEGCKKYLNKKIPIDEAPEIPNKNCPFEARVCLFAHYSPVVEFK